MRSMIGWLALLALGILLIVAGVQGNLGSLFGAFITPAQMIDVPTN